MIAGPPLPSLDVATINAALARAARTSHALIFVDAREQEASLSWAEVHERARRVAGALAERGVRPGDRVAMVLPTGADFMDAFFGTLLAGGVPVPLYPPVRLGRMDEYVRSTARMLEITGACIVLSDARVRLLLGGAVELARPPLGCPTVADLRAHGTPHEEQVQGAALALIQFSSGSTVAPKPVALTHTALVSQVAALRELLRVPDGSPATGVSWLPLYHDMGLVGCLLEALYYPGSLVLIPPELFLARPAIWLRALSRHRGIVSPAPNFAYGLCLKRLRDDDLAGLDLSHWRYALNGAEPVSADVQARFAERLSPFGFRSESLMPVYGLSECALAVTFTPSRGAKRVIGVDATALATDGVVTQGDRLIVSVGTPVPGAAVEVRDARHVPSADGMTGRIWVKAPFMMREYFGQREATATALRDGWLDTGDTGFIDGGELFIAGRAKDVVIIRGANHAPQEFEDAAHGVDGVRAGCAVAVGYVPPDGTDESLLILAEHDQRDVDDLADRIAAAVTAASGVTPHRVVVLEPGTLPRTSSGKLRRGEALRQFVAGTLHAPEAVTPLRVGVTVAKSLAAFARRSLAP